MDQDNNTPTASAGNKSAVPLIGGIILIIVIALLGWYLMQGQGATTVPLPSSTTTATPQVQQSASAETDAATAALSVQGTSDETTAIEADLNATNLNSLNDVSQL
jgi:cytoskeletal protein RodZ